MQEIQSLIVGAASHQALKIAALIREEAHHKLAVCRKPGSSAPDAKRFRYRCNHAHIPYAVEELIIDRRGAFVVPPNFLQGITGMNLLQDFRFSDHPRRNPVVGIAYIHVLNKPDPEAVLPGELHQFKDIVIVDAALNHGVNLDRIHPVSSRCREPFQNTGQIVPPGHQPEFFGIDGVEAHIDALQPGPNQCGPPFRLAWKRLL